MNGNKAQIHMDTFVVRGIYSPIVVRYIHGDRARASCQYVKSLTYKEASNVVVVAEDDGTLEQVEEDNTVVDMHGEDDDSHQPSSAAVAVAVAGRKRS